MSGNAWVCTIITVVLLASGAEQAYRAMVDKPKPPEVTYQQVGPQLGDPAPDFALPDEKGKQYRLAQFRGKPLVVSFYCGCSKCETIAKTLTPWQKQKNVAMVGLVTFKPEYMNEFRQKTGVRYPLLLDPNKEVGARWDSMICPRVWVLDKNGRVVTTNPQEPELMTPDETVQMVKQAYGKPAPAPQKAAVAPARSSSG
jgi:peroxiredoxin Q/BCP